MTILQQSTSTSTPENFFGGDNPRPVFATVTIAAGELTKGAVLGKKTADDEFILSVAAAEDGSEVPRAVLYSDAVDASEAAVEAEVVLMGSIAESALNFGAGHDADSVRWPLADVGIFIRTTVEV